MVKTPLALIELIGFAGFLALNERDISKTYNERTNSEYEKFSKLDPKEAKTRAIKLMQTILDDIKSK